MTATDRATPRAPCSRRAIATQRAAELARARARAGDPAATAGLRIRWCGQHLAFHLCHRHDDAMCVHAARRIVASTCTSDA
jgi:hypothetical protein